MNVSSGGAQADGASEFANISADGRYVVFVSEAENLVPNDTNDERDIFVHDLQTEVTSRVSVDSSGVEANHESLYPYISADGRYVAFHSQATNLVDDDTNNVIDVFVHDRQTGITERVSIKSNGAEGNARSEFPSINSDGRYIAFSSNASNLVSNDTNGWRDIFVRDRVTHQTSRVSLSFEGIEANGQIGDLTFISNDGSRVVFDSQATNLVLSDTNNTTDIFLRQWLEVSPTPTTTPSATTTPLPSSTATATSSPTTTSLPSSSPTVTGTTTSTPTTTITATNSATPPVGATMTPTPTPTPDSLVFIPVVLRQHAYATPVPPTITPTPTHPLCQVRDQEPNNLYIDADNLLPLCLGQSVSGAVSRATDVNDIYRIEIDDTSAAIQVTLTNLPSGADYDLYLDAGPGRNLAYSTNAGSANETISFTLSEGRYYLRVVARQDGNPNGYQLRWTR